MTAVLEEPIVRPSSTDDDLPPTNHFFCECDEDTALCGEDLTDCKKVDDDHRMEQDCPMCLMLIETECPRCGE